MSTSIVVYKRKMKNFTFFVYIEAERKLVRVKFNLQRTSRLVHFELLQDADAHPVCSLKWF